MADLELYGDEGGFEWEITGLGNDFTSDHYIRAGISTRAVSSGASSISGIVSYKNAGSSGSTSTGSKWVDYDPGTYTFYGWAQSGNGKYYPAGSGSVTVELGPPSAYFSITGTGTHSLTIRINVDSNYPYYRVYYRYTNDTSSGGWYPSSSFARHTSNYSLTISELDADTSYTINVQCATTSSGTKSTYLGAQTAKTDEITIEYWDWSISNSQPGSSEPSTAAQTKRAEQAVRQKLATTEFSYRVWNDMVDKVKEIVDAYGYSWSTLYPSYSNTRMTSSDKAMTAARFNSLRQNIGAHYSTGISAVQPGDPILGSYFITLANCINSWIDRGY